MIAWRLISNTGEKSKPFLTKEEAEEAKRQRDTDKIVWKVQWCII